MNKEAKVGLGFLVVLLLVVAVIISVRPDSKPLYAQKDACHIFTRNNAMGLLGGDPSKPIQQRSETASSKDVQKSSCTYQQAKPTMPPLSATVLVRAPRNDVGIANIKKDFKAKKPGGVQPVSAYGGDGWWDYKNGQLNILKHNTWYTLTFGQPNASNRNLSQTELLADAVSKKL